MKKPAPSADRRLFCRIQRRSVQAARPERLNYDLKATKRSGLTEDPRATECTGCFGQVPGASRCAEAGHLPADRWPKPWNVDRTMWRTLAATAMDDPHSSPTTSAPRSFRCRYGSRIFQAGVRAKAFADPLIEINRHDHAGWRRRLKRTCVGNPQKAGVREGRRLFHFCRAAKYA